MISSRGDGVVLLRYCNAALRGAALCNRPRTRNSPPIEEILERRGIIELSPQVLEVLQETGRRRCGYHSKGSPDDWGRGCGVGGLRCGASQMVLGSAHGPMGLRQECAEVHSHVPRIVIAIGDRGARDQLLDAPPEHCKFITKPSPANSFPVIIPSISYSYSPTRSSSIDTL
ncbi:hypothetical protein GQ53DRAFT_793447, partial [Thozetella sp. PMI_491]